MFCCCCCCLCRRCWYRWSLSCRCCCRYRCLYRFVFADLFLKIFFGYIFGYNTRYRIFYIFSCSSYFFNALLFLSLRLQVIPLPPTPLFFILPLQPLPQVEQPFETHRRQTLPSRLFALAHFDVAGFGCGFLSAGNLEAKRRGRKKCVPRFGEIL